MDDFDDEMTGVPFAPTAEEMAAEDQSAEVARLRVLLARWLRAADTNLWRDGIGLSLAATMVADDTRAALAATEAPADRSSPEDRERWLAEWHRKQRAADDAAV